MTSYELRDLRRRPLWATPVIMAVLVLTASLLVYEVLRANDPDALTVPLLGVPTAAGLLTAAALAAAYRSLSARTCAPLVRYVSRWVAAPERALQTRRGECWQVVVRNVGNGPAVIEDVSWLVEHAGAATAEVRTVQDLQASLARLELADARDYWIANYSPGMALGPNEERSYFECTDAVLKSVTRLEAVLRFRSLLGDRFEKRVSLVPHPGASAAVLGPRPDAKV